jgi:hypothetical protein
MPTKQKLTCEQLIDVELKDRLEQIRKSAGLDPDDDDYIEPLSIDRIVTYKVCLSWGGPADFFELDWDGKGWSGGRYIYQDWYDGATRKINADEAKELADTFGIYPDIED